MKSIQTYASLCGQLNLDTPRDAFITAICKSSLPPHYALTVLNTVTQGATLRAGLRDSQELNAQLVAQYGEADYRQQVVAVGTPLPTSSVPAGKIVNVVNKYKRTVFELSQYNWQFFLLVLLNFKLQRN